EHARGPPRGPRQPHGAARKHDTRRPTPQAAGGGRGRGRGAGRGGGRRMKRNPAPHLAEDDLTPLVQATASRALDTCLRGARGLQVLVTALREAPPKGDAAGPALELLGRALNDAAAGVRGEAFKAALNLQVSGGGVRTLRFVLGSIHADVRREVLTEVMAQAN